MKIETMQLEKAILSLEKALHEEKNEYTRDATIQRFEYTVELSWKTGKKVMGTAQTSPRQVIRELAQSGLIDDPEFWFLALENRNLSSHSYKEELAERVYNFCKSFLPQAKNLLSRLQKVN
jgi:nucleotidyltransferase substrate binding protein (TIGR01987 family)